MATINNIINIKNLKNNKINKINVFSLPVSSILCDKKLKFIKCYLMWKMIKIIKIYVMNEKRKTKKLWQKYSHEDYTLLNNTINLLWFW